MKVLKSLVWILPASLSLGALLSLGDGGTWWIGFLAYSLLLSLALSALSALWRRSGSPPALIWMLLLAFCLRLGAGVFFSWALPLYGNDSTVHQAGYIFQDAHTYDSQSWALARSGSPLWLAFDRTSSIEEQYGGLTLLSSLIYRLLSPDLHRPWLILLVTALAGAAAAALAWKGASRAWGERIGWTVGWVMALYPESVLAGASTIREPFLTFFLAAAFATLTGWQANRSRSAWFWMAACFLAALLFSPGAAVFAILVLGAWTWLRRREFRLRWWWIAAAALLGGGGILFLGVLVGGTLEAPAGPLANLVDWLRFSALYSAYETEMQSGWIQTLFKSLPDWLHLPFITAYGVAQPVLPAAITDAAVWPSRLLAILRALGWYALLPLLVYSLRPILKSAEKGMRTPWLWLWLTTWAWIILCSFRAGGDQWDNPRYRLMFLLIQAGLAAFALSWARQTRDRWFGRTLAVEGAALLLLGYWYVARYAKWEAGQVHILVIFALILVTSLLILAGGWIQDHHRKHTPVGQPPSPNGKA